MRFLLFLSLISLGSIIYVGDTSAEITIGICYDPVTNEPVDCDGDDTSEGADRALSGNGSKVYSALSIENHPIFRSSYQYAACSGSDFGGEAYCYEQISLSACQARADGGYYTYGNGQGNSLNGDRAVYFCSTSALDDNLPVGDLEQYAVSDRSGGEGEGEGEGEGLGCEGEEDGDLSCLEDLLDDIVSNTDGNLASSDLSNIESSLSDIESSVSDISSALNFDDLDIGSLDLSSNLSATQASYKSFITSIKDDISAFISLDLGTSSDCPENTIAIFGVPVSVSLCRFSEYFSYVGLALLTVVGIRSAFVIFGA